MKNASRAISSTKKIKGLRPQTAGLESENGSVGVGTAGGRRFDGSRMTIKQMLKNEARSAGVPVARVTQRVQIDAENGDEVSLRDDGREGEEQARSLDQHQHHLNQNQNRNTRRNAGGSHRSIPDTTQSTPLGSGTSDGGNSKTSELDDKDEEQSIIHRLFQPSTGALLPKRSPSQRIHKTSGSIQLLSQLHRDENGEVSSGQKQLFGSQSIPNFPTCSAASTLVDSMNAKFTKQLDQATYEKILAFQEKQLSVDSLHIQAAVGDYYQSERMLQKQRNNQVLSAQASAASHHHHSSVAPPHSAAASIPSIAIETTIEDSLSKLKLRNAVDLANTLLDPKQQKRMLQTLIDADEKVIEEERVAQEQTAHKYRLHLTNARSYTPHDNK